MALDRLIVSMVEDAISSPTGNVPGIRVTYKLGTFGPFIETIPKVDFTAAELNKRTDAMRAQIATATGETNAY